MCLVVYLAADETLPLIEWDETNRGFHVTELDREQDESVRPQFTKPHVYYAGSQTICGCGFNYGQHPDAESDTDELELRERTLRSLADYLERECLRSGAVELYVCWEGDQAEPSAGKRFLTPAELLQEGFFFEERELLEFTPTEPSR